MRKSLKLLVAVGALVLLGVVSYVVVGVSRVRLLSTASLGKVKADLVTIDSVCVEFAANNRWHYPDSLASLMELDMNGRKYSNWTVMPRDPWGREYLYEVPASLGAKPRVWTLGRDGVPGGDRDDQDFGNWMLR